MGILFFVIYISIGVFFAIRARSIEMKRRDQFRRAYPWLSKLMPYDKEKQLPTWFTETGRLEIWILRIGGLLIAGFGLHALLVDIL